MVPASDAQASGPIPNRIQRHGLNLYAGIEIQESYLLVLVRKAGQGEAFSDTY
ncbi:hypothetical protein D9M71_591460 [compost metagenome]